jgi:hypothetical protein
MYAWGTLKEKGDNCRIHRKIRTKGEGCRGRLTYQRLVTLPFVATPSEIPSYTIQQHITKVSELWDEHWNVSRGI